MENETKHTARQQAILALLGKGSLPRIKIQNTLKARFKVSRVTLFRDLRSLINSGAVSTTGVGRATQYSLTSLNPLLVLPKKNFATSEVKFNFEIFGQLKNLLVPSEVLHLHSIYKSLNSQIAKLDLTIAKRELERFIIELAWKSSHIEGNTYSLLETETLIKTRQEAEGHSKEEATMILNHKSAFETILDHRHDFQRVDFKDVSQLHNTLIAGMNIDTGIRSHPVGVTGSIYRPLDNQWQIREAMDKLMKALDSLPHPFEKALVAASMIAYIQPFTDGNKRTSRMLSNAILMAYDYFPISYRAVNETDYKQALIYFYEQNSLIHFKRIFIEQYLHSLSNYFRTNN